MYFEELSKIHILIDRDKLDLAQQKITEKLSIYPDSGELYGLLARVYYKKDQTTQALEAIDQAIGLEPENDFLFFIKSKILSQKSAFKKANQTIDQAIEINPNVGVYYGMKAALLIDTNQLNDAVVYAKKGIAVDPNDLMSNNMLSLAQNKLGNAAEALERLEHMLADDPENAFTQANIGYYYLRVGNIPKAKEHFAVSLQNNPNSEFAKGGMIDAIKSTNWFFRKLLQFAYWMEKIGTKNRWALILGLIAIVWMMPILLPFYLIFVFWTWFTGPISDAVLYFDKYGKYLMTPLNRQLSLINVVLIGMALLCCFLALPLNNIGLFGTAFGIFLSILPIYSLARSDKRHHWAVMIGFALIFSGLGLMCIFSSQYAGTILLAAVAFTWVSSLVK